MKAEAQPTPHAQNVRTLDKKNMTAAKQKITTTTTRSASVSVRGPRPRPITKANLALVPRVSSAAAFGNEDLRKIAFYADHSVLILNMDVRTAMEHLARAGVIVNCIVTSPPFYGQRDYEVEGQIGLEEHPSK